MIRVKLFFGNEFLVKVIGHSRHSSRKATIYTEDLFYKIQESYGDEKPFSDKDSVDLLQNCFGYELPDDRYSVKSKYGRTCFAQLSVQQKYCLTLINQSKKGIYLGYKMLLSPYADYLNNLPFDILIALDASSMSSNSCNILSLGTTKFIVENYPYNNLKVEVIYEEHSDNMSLKVGDNYGYTKGLYIGKNGSYYLSATDFRKNMQFSWKEHLSEIVSLGNKALENMTIPRKFCDTRKEYKTFQFFRETGLTDFFYMQDYIASVNDLKKYIEEDPDNIEFYKEDLEDLKYSDMYDKYKFLRDEFKIINNLAEEPSRFKEFEPLMMCITEIEEGKYYVSGRLADDLPTFTDIIMSALKFLEYDSVVEGNFIAKYILVVDVSQAFSSIRDIEKAKLGFKLTPKSLEIYDRAEGILTFVDVARKALESSNLIMSKECY